MCGKEFNRDEEGHGPDLREQADEKALVELLGEPGPEKELADEENICRDLWISARCALEIE